MLEVVAAVIVKKNRIFAARRSPKKHFGGLWELPGGKVEKGESHQQALARELYEELNIKSNIGELAGATYYQNAEDNLHLSAYWVKEWSGAFKLEDHDIFQWVSKEDSSNINWAPADIPIINQLFTGP